MNDQPPTMSRRAFAKAVSASALAALITSGCRPNLTRAITLRFWNGFTGPDGRTILQIIKRFNSINDDVQIVMQRMEWATYYNKVFVAAMNGRAPDIFVVHTDNLERFIRAGLVAPVDAVFGQNGVQRDDIDANVIAAVERQGKAYGLPLDCHPLGMYYNRQLFADAGIGRPPANQAEFIDALYHLKKADSGHGAQWGFVYEWLRINAYTLIRQWGGGIIGDNGSVILDSDENRQALAFAASLIQDRHLVPSIENVDAFLGFRQGRIGMVWAGIFKLQDVTRQADLDFGAAVVPVVGKQPAVWGDSHNLCLRNGLNDEQMKAAERFLKFLSDNTLDWAAGGQVPVRKSLRNSDRFRSMYVQAEFAKQLPYVQYLPSTPYTFEYQTEFDTACERVLRGNASPDIALKEAAANVRKIATAYASGGPA